MPYKRGQQWIAQVRKDGQRANKVFQTKKEARDWEAEMKRKPVSEWHGPTDTACLIDWAEAYLDYAKARYSTKTYKEKRSMFQRLFREIDPEMPVEELTPALVMDYVVRQSQVRTGHGANKDRKNLVAGWNWGLKYFNPPLPGPNPCLVDKMPENRKPRYVPPVADFWKVFDVAERQDQVMLLAYLHLGARRCEVFRLAWEDVDFGESRIRLGTHKRAGGNLEFDWLPMTDDLYNTLLEHRQTADGQWVFLNPKTGQPYRTRKRWMTGLCRKAEVKAFGLHAIRHLTASILASEGVPPIQIQAILRHKRLSTTEGYLHRLGDLKPVLKVLSRNKKPSEKPSEKIGAERKIRVVK